MKTNQTISALSALAHEGRLALFRLLVQAGPSGMAAGDLVITADIPLAANVIEKGGYALNPRGEFYDKGNIRERLSMRNFMETLRNSGVETAGPPAFSNRDREAFANQLDRFLSKRGG